MTRGELIRKPPPHPGAEDVITMPNGVRLQRGQEWWEDNPHRLAARIRRETRAGRIHEVARYRVQEGRHGAIIARLKPAASRRRIAALWLSGAAVAASAVAAATWWVAVHLEEILTVIFAATVAALLLGSLTRFLGGHRPTCAGLHCP